MLLDPFDNIKNVWPDATRWYMITNANPWDNLKFDLEGIDRSTTKVFRNTCTILIPSLPYMPILMTLI